MTWEPIETAPKDGTEFIAYDGSYMEVCKFEENGDLVLAWTGTLFSCSPLIQCDASHWMPLPEPPK